jgi:hypothetical protein
MSGRPCKPGFLERKTMGVHTSTAEATTGCLHATDQPAGCRRCGRSISTRLDEEGTERQVEGQNGQRRGCVQSGEGFAFLQGQEEGQWAEEYDGNGGQMLVFHQLKVVGVSAGRAIGRTLRFSRCALPFVPTWTTVRLDPNTAGVRAAIVILIFGSLGVGSLGTL